MTGCQLFFRRATTRLGSRMQAAETERLVELLVPFDPSLMSRYPVSSLVNKLQNDGPECALEISDKIPNPETQMRLW